MPLHCERSASLGQVGLSETIASPPDCDQGEMGTHISHPCDTTRGSGPVPSQANILERWKYHSHHRER